MEPTVTLTRNDMQFILNNLARVVGEHNGMEMEFTLKPEKESKEE